MKLLLIFLFLFSLWLSCLAEKEASERYFHARVCSAKESKRVNCFARRCSTYFGCGKRATCCYSWKCGASVCVPKRKNKINKINDERCRNKLFKEALRKQCNEGIECSSHSECGIPKSCCWSRVCRKNICVPLGPLKG